MTAAERAWRRARAVQEVAWLVDRRAVLSFGPRSECAICSRPIKDTGSQALGVGVKCWAAVMAVVDERRAARTAIAGLDLDGGAR